MSEEIISVENPVSNTEINYTRSFKSSDLVEILPGLLKDLWGFKKVDLTKKNLQTRFANIKGDLQVLIEYPYVDKLYRNSFYREPLNTTFNDRDLCPVILNIKGV